MLKEIVEKCLKQATITASRSSAPGGQNVNTSNSKATLRFPRPTTLPLPFRTSGTHYTVSCQQYRSFEENKKECINLVRSGVERAWRKWEAGRAGPTAEKQALVREHNDRFRLKVMTSKQQRKAVKKDRGKQPIE